MLQPVSMLAHFVEVSPEQLDELQRDPSAVADLFEPEPGQPFGATPLSGEARERFEREAPLMLARTLEALDPAMREALREHLRRLGVDPTTLSSGAGGGSILELMESRASIGAGEGPPAPPEASNGHGALALEKAWHGVHFLLCGEGEPQPGLRGVVMGGREIGDDEFGYGPARYFRPAETAAIAAELRAVDPETELRSRYEPERMTALGIYPGGWSAEDGDWLLESFGELRDFFGAAAGRGSAVLTCIV
jgi:hypothetical protein